MKKIITLCAAMVALAVTIGCDKELENPSVSDTTGGGNVTDTIPVPPDTIPTPHEYTFVPRVSTFAGQQLQWQAAAIGEVHGGGTRMVIYLHGGTSRGNDNTAQLSEPAVDSLAHYLARQTEASLLLVPQCPQSGNWDAPRIRNALRMLVERYADSGYVATNQVYLLGGSMGGTGTWNILSAYPRLFAAGMVCAGNPSRASADSLALTPVYVVMGTSDNIMSITVVESFLAQLDSLGATYRYDVEQDWTHEQTCIQSYTSARLNWVFAQRRE